MLLMLGVLAALVVFELITLDLDSNVIYLTPSLRLLRFGAGACAKITFTLVTFKFYYDK